MSNKPLLSTCRGKKSFRKSPKLFLFFAKCITASPCRDILSCILLCYELIVTPAQQGVKAHSIRAQWASVASLHSVPLREIWGAAKWGSVHAFARHYNLVEVDTSFSRAFLLSMVLQDSSCFPSQWVLLVCHLEWSTHRNHLSWRRKNVTYLVSKCVVPMYIPPPAILSLCFR